MTARTPKGRAIAEKLTDDFNVKVYGLPHIQRHILKSYFEQAISQAVNEALDEAIEIVSDPLYWGSAKDRIIKLKAAYAKGEKGE